MSNAEYPTLNYNQRGLRAFRPRRPSSVWGWLLWLLVAALFYLFISYGLMRWWQKPVPTDLPPTPPSSDTRSS